MNQGTVITASGLFYNNETRRSSISATEEKKRVIKLMGHFWLHYCDIKFRLETEKGEELEPMKMNSLTTGEKKMKIFQAITKLSFDKYRYLPPQQIEEITL